jgi:DNA-binding NtrC family response regulator
MVSLDHPLPGMVGADPAMRDVYRMVRQVAPLDDPVAIVGETGTGKELVARALHQASERASRPLAVINAATLPETLFESELFGHTRDAFSGARHEKPGLVETAHESTLYLDELGAVPAVAQAKLLRVIEDGTARRVGGLLARPARPRWVVSAQGWAACGVVGAGVRPDLWHRLAAVVIALPPLRERRDDVPLLADAFLRERGLDLSHLDEAALARLAGHDWPGNVRELRRVVGRLSLRCNGGRITAAMVRAELRPGRATDALPPTAAPLRTLAEALRDAEREAIDAALARAGGSRAQAAELLGISEATLYRRLAHRDSQSCESESQVCESPSQN